MITLRDIRLKRHERFPQAREIVLEPSVLTLSLVDLQNEFCRQRFKSCRFGLNDFAFFDEPFDFLPLCGDIGSSLSESVGEFLLFGRSRVDCSLNAFERMRDVSELSFAVRDRAVQSQQIVLQSSQLAPSSQQ